MIIVLLKLREESKCVRRRRHNERMSFVWQIISAVPYSNKPIVKDVIASLHSYFTYNMLIAFSIVISFKHFGGRPMECMLPMGFSGAWEQYAENFCWAQDTYFVPPKIFVEEVTAEERRERRISYYQWMPFFLLFQAVCFKAPTLIWKYFAGHSGMKLGEILRLASDPANSAIEVKKANIDALCVHLQGALRFHSRLKKKKLVPHKILRFLNIKYSSYYVATVYVVAKVAFLANSCFQIRLLNRYFLPEFQDNFGVHALHNILFPNENDSSWHTSGIFPRVTLCDFEVREMGNIQTHTVQCVLVVNILTEKIFILLWTWFVVLSAITAVSLVNWLYLLGGDCSKEHFLLNHLEMSETPFDRKDPENEESVNRFVHKYLGTDGIFVLRMIAAHADVVFTTELISALWRSHYSFEQQRRVLRHMSLVWPQHEQRLEKALMEEAEVAARLGDDAPDWLLQRRRSFYKDLFASPPVSLAKSTPSPPFAVMSEESLKEALRTPRGSLSGVSGVPRPSISAVGSGRLRRRRSLEHLEGLGSDKIKKFADSSSDDDESKEKNAKRSVSSSRRSSRVKF